MTSAVGTVQMTLKMLKEASSLDSDKAQALTSLRRLHLNEQKMIKTISNKDFCELCSVILGNLTENTLDDRLLLEAQRTLDIILPESRDKNFDFFKTVLQINRKKRLKILESLSILKDETVATIVTKSAIDFLYDCLESIQPKSMTWLLPENADNSFVINTADRVLDENEEFEERVVDRSLELLCRMCDLSSCGLSIKQFDTFIMDKVVLLAFMGNERQRSQALKVLQLATKNDLGTRVRSFQKEIWDKFKQSLQNVYCKRMTLLVNECCLEWAQQWETSIALVGTDLHKGSTLVNSLLKVEELAFKSGDINRKQAFLSWKCLIDNFALEPRELATVRRIKLLCVPLNAKNSRTEVMVLTKMEVWWHLLIKICSSLSEFTDTVLVPFLTICFGPFGDKPLFVQVNDSSAALGKKFVKTQIFAIEALAQLIVNNDLSKIPASIVNENLPNTVNNAVFEKIYKILIYCFGESIVLLGLSPNDVITNKPLMVTIMWENLLARIEGYDKMKVPMYQEISSVVSELIKHQFIKIPLISDFLMDTILKDFHKILKNGQFTESAWLELINTFLKIDDFSRFTKDHCMSFELLLNRVVKPSSANAYYPETLELMQAVLKSISEAKKNHVVYDIWCILARIAQKYIEDAQPINEGTSIEYNFKTIESITAFPFISCVPNDISLMKKVAEAWCSFFKVFDYQAELVVVVKPNVVLEKTSKMIISSMQKNSQCCDFAAVCIDALLAVVNYDHLSSKKEVPEFVNLLKNLTIECLRSESFASDQVLKALASFLLRVFSHSIEKTALYLKTVEPAVKLMISKIDHVSFGSEILKTWTDIVGLFTRLQKSLNDELLSCYRQTIIMAAWNPTTAAATFPIADINCSVDEKTRNFFEELAKELSQIMSVSKVQISDAATSKKKTAVVGSFLGRKMASPSTRTPGKENFVKPKVMNIEPDSQDFVVINSEVKLDVGRLTEHQKEKLKKRKDDIPAMYNELTVSNSQDSQQLQEWFDAKAKSTANQKKEATNNNTEAVEAGLPSTFRNITQALPHDQEKVGEKTVAVSCTSGSEAATSKDAGESSSATVAKESPQRQRTTNSPEATALTSLSNVTPETPDEAISVAARVEEEQQQLQKISPSIIEGVKMRRKNTAEESAAAGTPVGTAEKNHNPRRSGQLKRLSLKKFNSSDQLHPLGGKKRRNSDSNSDGALSIERVKRPRITESLEVCNSLDSNKSDGEEKKNLPKKTLIELNRLQIDMVFETLPNRRYSAGKETTATGDKKLKEDKVLAKYKEDKVATPAKAKEVATPIKAKDDKDAATTISKFKEGKGAATPSKLRDTSPTKSDSSQQQKIKVKRHSLKGFDSQLLPILMKSDANKQKESTANNKERKADSAEGPNNRGTRKSLPETIETVSKKKNETQVPNSQEVVEIECVSVEEEIETNEPSIPAKSTVSGKASMDMKATQDPDIVESSQEPSFHPKFGKSECVIKIKKVEMLQKPIPVEKVPEIEISEAVTVINKKIIDETPADSEDNTVSVFPVTVDAKKTTAIVELEAKTVENNIGKPATATNPTSSPKGSTSRIFKKNFAFGGRAAWMVDLVTKQSVGDKVGSPETTKSDFNLTDEVTIVPLKKDKSIAKETERVSSPLNSRQSKMFSNMNNFNNLKAPERSSSPSMAMFCNLKNDGERISPKLEKHLQAGDNDIINTQKELFSQNDTSDSSEDSPKKKELPILEWSNANPPSLTASPSASILKRMQECELETPGSKKKRVSFADPPVSRQMGYEIMTDTSSPPRLEKLPTVRSPIGTRRLRRRMEREMNESNSNLNQPPSPKIKLLTMLESHENDDILMEDQVSKKQNRLEEELLLASAASEIKAMAMTKTSTQTELNYSPVKPDSISISSISRKSTDRSVSLEDTIDINNLSTSLNWSYAVTANKKILASFQKKDQPADPSSVSDSVFSDPALLHESQNSVAQLNQPEALDSMLPVCPSLTSCNDAVDTISAELVDPMFVDDLAKHFLMKCIRTVGELAQLTEREINRLPIVSPKVDSVKRALSRYEEKLRIKSPEKKIRIKNCVSSSTPMEKKRPERTKSIDDSFEELEKKESNDLDSSSYDCKMRGSRVSKRLSIDSSIQTSPVKRSKKDDERACLDLMAQCDDDILLNQLVKRFDFQKVLQGYNIKTEDLMSLLSKNLVEENKKGISILTPKSDDLKVILDNTSVETIVEHVKSREELKSSTTLLNVVLDNSADKMSILKKIWEKCDPSAIVDTYSEWVKSEILNVQKK
ncbi:telomere-associated protein RIF1 [Copidosoma floridanum]|uniref:telomere-associated protein RIF1 n=1 Tax=Copidosoma floridanum TaxID=29053 RepID=UPI000C6F71BC|nr:telomere-associated protein RIF1 [Copidosoma floridanum]